jgi:hypothetical protein
MKRRPARLRNVKRSFVQGRFRGTCWNEQIRAQSTPPEKGTWFTKESTHRLAGCVALGTIEPISAPNSGLWIDPQYGARYEVLPAAFFWK